jgi:gluconokinase
MIVIVMGVVGAGKTTVGGMLADQLHWEFTDADDFHPPYNVEKIRDGIPLTDADRKPWLDLLHQAITQWTATGKSVVLACSALKASYRSNLKASQEVRFVYLKGSASLIAERLHERHGHFAGESILASQLADLEEPEDALTVDISSSPHQIVEEIRKGLGLG